MEDLLIERASEFDNIDLRWGHRLEALEANETGAVLSVSTTGGGYRIQANWVIACDGNKSTTRDLMGLDFEVGYSKITSLSPTSR